MFRKILHIIVVVTLIIGTSGVTISKHYCGDSLVSVSLNHQDAGCGMKGNCCHNETMLYKVTDNFAASHFEFKSQTAPLIAVLHFGNELVYSFKLYSNQHIYSFCAPPINKSSAILQVFRC